MTSNESRGGRRYIPFAFTEHGAIMATNILRSKRSMRMSVFVVRAFVSDGKIHDYQRNHDELRMAIINNLGFVW